VLCEALGRDVTTVRVVTLSGVASFAKAKQATESKGPYGPHNPPFFTKSENATP